MCVQKDHAMGPISVACLLISILFKDFFWPGMEEEVIDVVLHDRSHARRLFVAPRVWLLQPVGGRCTYKAGGELPAPVWLAAWCMYSYICT